MYRRDKFWIKLLISLLYFFLLKKPSICYRLYMDRKTTITSSQATREGKMKISMRPVFYPCDLADLYCFPYFWSHNRNSPGGWHLRDRYLDCRQPRDPPHQHWPGRLDADRRSHRQDPSSSMPESRIGIPAPRPRSSVPISKASLAVNHWIMSSSPISISITSDM